MTTGKYLKIFDTQIPMGIKAAETAISGKSIFAYDKNREWSQKRMRTLRRRC